MTMPESRPINKEVFLESRLCLTRGWYIHHGRGPGPPREADRLRMEEGQEVGRRARRLYAGGVYATAVEGSGPADRTQALMRDPNVSTIFEATFVTDGVAAKADVIQRHDGGWHVREVKSSLNDKPELLEDLAYTTMVMRRAGVRVTKASLLLLSRDYRLGMDHGRLFVEIDHTADIGPVIASFEADLPRITRELALAERPMPRLIPECKDCPFFENECLGRDVDHPILELPRLDKKKLALLAAKGISRITQVPAGFELTEQQEVVRKAVVSGGPVKDLPALRGLLSQVRWPARYLDFETLQTAVPLYPGVAPHQQIPTQYSVHVCEAPGTLVSHREYLADPPSRDCRRELAQRLIEDLAGEGSIVVYSSFEKRILGELGTIFPDLKDSLRQCADRLFDLEPTLRPGCFYHPGFRGRSSIKFTLPVLVSSMSYDSLAIGDGDTALAMFARMAKGQCLAEEVPTIRANLLAYCAQDTLAMVRLHERLIGLV